MIEKLQGNMDTVMLSILAALLVLIVLNIYILIRQSMLNERYKKFMRGKDGKSLENTFTRRIGEIDHLLVANQENEEMIREVDRRTGVAMQKIGVYRYDAFEEMNGQLSFAIAMLNARNDGFVMNSVHNGEGCFVYYKEIIGGNSYTKLTSEEQEAVDRALGNEEE